MKTDVQPDRFRTDLRPQPAQVALHNNLFLRLDNLVIIQPPDRLDGHLRLIFLIRLFDFLLGEIANHKLDRNGLIQYPDKQSLYRAPQARLQPVTGMCIPDLDGQPVFFQGNGHGVPHPGVEGGTRHFHLELTENGLPGLVCPAKRR
ncbi:MAG TPA: hypothetical protein VLA72_18535 [Anaerolineales bacterium]|nr:hypothetical protein [Anaerolineales bacterium]